MKLEELQPGVRVRGIVPNQVATIVNVEWHDDAINVVFRDEENKLAENIFYRDAEERLELVTQEQVWAFDANGNLFKLVSEACRIQLAYLFDPMLGIYTSLIEPLPHQITAVYEEMLPRQPLRFLLADDPGAGKTIMAGLLIRELVVRGDVQRCLVCAPGNLVEQWQDELWEKFQLEFDILTREMVEASRSGNPFQERSFVIVRLDQMSRSDDLLARLKQSDWDLIICDEAHKMSASFFGNEVKETKRYKLGKLLSSITRHFLLLTATPHNGKEEDFQLFLALLDEDRFEGRFREGVEPVDVSDLMRRMVKEELRKFDGRPLFPERRAYTVRYQLSDEERDLYDAVTEYVCQEFNRAEQLQNDGRKGTVGFALTILQRRLASSPEAIYQSLRRRRERLESRLEEIRKTPQLLSSNGDEMTEEDYWEEFDEVPSAELEKLEAELIDRATAASTIDELQLEINLLRKLEEKAFRVRHSDKDRKWNELRQLLQDTPEMREPNDAKRLRKLVIFTEHRDTLNYLRERLITFFGRDDFLVCIYGGMRREERREVEEQFRNNPDVTILLATDAAGEGINLQRAHLMVNYDLPWNPNRLEQRFGRIHRIGQTEVCHLWNLLAEDTREGHVYKRLLQKLEVEHNALGGRVFDVLGDLFINVPLRKLLIDAIRYGDDPQVRSRLEQQLDDVIDSKRVRELLERHSLAADMMDVSKIIKIREDMERAAAQRLQPYYIKSFFEQAFEYFGGKLHQCEAGRYIIRYVPATIRDWAKQRGMKPIAEKYERVCFDKAYIHVLGKPSATLICPGHPLLDSLIGLILTRERGVLQRGAILVDENDTSQELRVLLYLEHTIQDAVPIKSEHFRVISQEVHFLEINADGEIQLGGGAPYLDYREITDEEKRRIQPLLAADWLQGDSLGKMATSYAIKHLVPRHLERVKQHRLAYINKVEFAVRARLQREINYWDARANQLKEQEKAGQYNAKLNSKLARERADRLHERLQQRQHQFEQERDIRSRPPRIVGGALIVPMGLLASSQKTVIDSHARKVVERVAMEAVLRIETDLGHTPHDVSHEKIGYDIESRDGQTERLRFIEVKGIKVDAHSVTLTRNELLRAANSPEQFILAIVRVDRQRPVTVHYVRNYAFREPDPLSVSVNYDLEELLAFGEALM
ncbi:MAG: DUF3883 domain-containing protein [Chloroflexi bacterium]|nr:MAG: DUF3883 domain-containing protein [Chloroflexota bacterium]